jgi:tetratricopeptide (TPR) repeat protein
MSNLAAVYGLTQRLDESRKLLEEALEVQRRVVGEGGRDTLTTMHNLAMTYLNMKRLDDARQMYEKTLDLERLHLGVRDPFTLRTTLGMADLLAFEGRHDMATDLRQEVLKLGLRSLPPEHPILMQARDDLASSLWKLGRHGASIKRYEEILEIQRRALKPGHPRTMSTLNTLAWRLATAPDPQDRDPRRAAGLAREVVEHSPKQSTAWNTLGVASYRAGVWKDAVTALEKSEELAPGKSLGYNAVFLAMAHWQQGEKEKARQWYDRALTWIEKNGRPDPDLLQFQVEATQLLGLAGGGQ